MYILLLKRCGHWSFPLICDFVRTNLISLSCNFSNNFFLLKKAAVAFHVPENPCMLSGLHWLPRLTKNILLQILLNISFGTAS